MSSDFFQRQDRARRQTWRLLVMFGLSVAAIILAIYLIAAVGLAQSHGRGVRAPSMWRPDLFLAVAGGTLLVITAGSLYKIAELASGGEAVALMLGGRAIDPQTGDPAERRLQNIVEEMALASGVPVPPIYVLDNEPSINAFAAGHQPGDAVVAVSQGCLQYLNRDELQGVVGHEFSHILNGDMRLNLRLIGLVNGILVLAIVGYFVMRSVNTGRYSSSRDDRQGGGAAGIFMIGLALYILGYLGVFFGNIIKSAISRQREYLADASAVQFTRNPGGLAGALKKIGGLADGSRIRDAHASEISHMFFGDAFAGSFFNLFATHPPLDERIRLLEPNFDGHFPEVEPVDEGTESPATRLRPAAAAAYPVAGLAGEAVSSQAAQQPPAVQDVAILDVLPPTLAGAAREPMAAQAVIFALLLSRDDRATRDRQVQTLQAQVEPALLRPMQPLVQAVDQLPAELRLPLVDLTIPALKRLSRPQYMRMRLMVEALTGADGKVDLFEYCLRVVLFSYLDVHFELRKPAGVHYRSVGQVGEAAVVVLSSLAYAGHNRPEDVQRAFHSGADGLLGQGASLLPAEQCTFPQFDMALVRLAQAAPAVKRDLIGAALATIATDGQTTLEESGLLRAIAAALGCPLSPGFAR